MNCQVSQAGFLAPNSLHKFGLYLDQDQGHRCLPVKNLIKLGMGKCIYNRECRGWRKTIKKHTVDVDTGRIVLRVPEELDYLLSFIEVVTSFFRPLFFKNRSLRNFAVSLKIPSHYMYKYSDFSGNVFCCCFFFK